MADAFPRTMIEDLSVPRLIVGTNWFLGFSHTTKALDDMIKTHQTRENLVPILETFMNAGIDAIYGVRPESPQLEAALSDVEDKVGKGWIKMGTPHFDLSRSQEADDDNRRTIEGFAKMGCRVCLPHQATTDALLDKTTKTIRNMEHYAALIREYGMIPGLSTHMPESIPYADAADLDVGTYIQIYNAAGFLMQVEGTGYTGSYGKQKSQ